MDPLIQQEDVAGKDEGESAWLYGWQPENVGSFLIKSNPPGLEPMLYNCGLYSQIRSGIHELPGI